jgi:hypothetical protein
VDLAHGAEQLARLSVAEYDVLRRTIAVRGTARMLVAPTSCVGWAALALVQSGANGNPLAALISLSVLVAGFESVHALHVGSERIGRYLQVYYEADVSGPRWESTAMLVGPALPGGGIDPLFSGLFVGAGLLNFMTAEPTRLTPMVLAVMMTAHAAFAFRIVRARLAATRQRAVELESFKALQSRERARS